MGRIKRASFAYFVPELHRVSSASFIPLYAVPWDKGRSRVWGGEHRRHVFFSPLFKINYWSRAGERTWAGGSRTMNGAKREARL